MSRPRPASHGDHVDAAFGMVKDLVQDSPSLIDGSGDQGVLQIPHPALGEAPFCRPSGHRQDQRECPEERHFRHRGCQAARRRVPTRSPAPEGGHLEHGADLIGGAVVRAVAVEVVERMTVGQQDPERSAHVEKREFPELKARRRVECRGRRRRVRLRPRRAADAGASAHVRLRGGPPAACARPQPEAVVWRPRPPNPPRRPPRRPQTPSGSPVG